jgi:polysaccharide pyruvyl transferase WcaK-like protein
LIEIDNLKRTTRFYSGEGSQIILPLENQSIGGRLSQLARLNLAQELFEQNPHKFRERAREAFPYLLKGPLPTIRSNLGQLITYNYDLQQWEEPKRDVARERNLIREYLTNLDYYLPTQPQHYPVYGYSSLIKEQASLLPPMNKRCRAVVVIPVLNEAAIAKRLIDEFSYQKLDSSRFEILIVLNSSLSASRDNTEELIKSMQFANLSLPLHLISFRLPPPFHGGGFSRRIGSDVTFLRSLQRPKQEAPLYIVCDDADCMGINPDHLAKIISTFDNNPGIDIVRRLAPRDPLALAEHDLAKLHFSIRVMTECYFFPRIGRKISHLVPYTVGRLTDSQFWLRTPTSGADMAISAESLALITGGFEPVLQRSDLPQGPKIAVLRGLPLEEELFLSSASLRRLGELRSFQDARREKGMLLKRLTENNFSTSNYQSFTNDEFTALLRDKKKLLESLKEEPNYGKYADFSLLDDEALVDVTNQMLSYYTEIFFPYVFSHNPAEAAGQWSSFLSVYVGGQSGTFADKGNQVILDRPKNLKEAFSIYHNRFSNCSFFAYRSRIEGNESDLKIIDKKEGPFIDKTFEIIPKDSKIKGGAFVSITPRKDPIKYVFHYTVRGPRLSSYPPPNRGDYAASEGITRELTRRLGKNVEFSTLSLRFDQLTPSLVDEINEKAASLLIGGGGLYSRRESTSHWYFPSNMELIQKIKVPIILAGIGHNRSLLEEINDPENPYEVIGPEALDSIRLINQQAALSSVRDPYTAKLLKNARVTCPNGIEVLPDPASLLFLNTPTPQIERSYIGISLAFHEKQLIEHLPKLVSSIADFLNQEHLVKYPVLFLAHAPDERFIAYHLQREGIKISHVVDTHNLDQIGKELASCYLLITQKMHPAILAWSQRTPFISLNYDVKQKAFHDFIGLQEFGIDFSEISLQSLNTIYTKMEKIGFENISAKMRDCLNSYQTKVNTFFDKAAKIIEGR